MDCGPNTSIPANDPEPTAVINKIAMITSGNVRTKLNANFPVLAIVFPLLLLLAA